MIIEKSNKIDFDKLKTDELSDKAKIVLKAIVDLKNAGEEKITNSLVSENTELTPRQVVGVVNGITKKGMLERDKAKVMVEKEVTIFKLKKEGE
jgi:methyl coenzyme M reductase subunit C